MVVSDAYLLNQGDQALDGIGMSNRTYRKPNNQVNKITVL
jgi:hypothetical protein